MRWRLLGGLILTLTLGLTARLEAQAPIRIGEINSYTGIAAGFTLPYRQAVEMAVGEVNAGRGIPARGPAPP
jgi:ABC-type branched-subunit amino acid transport system substrate-binding protein